MNFAVVSILLLSAGLLQAQQSYDSYSYLAPKGYNARDAKDYRELSRIDQQRRFYCQIVLYEAQQSLGSAKADLENEWKATVLKSSTPKGKATERALPLPLAPDSIIRSSQATTMDGRDSIWSLFVIRFAAKYVGIIFSVPHQQAFEACQEEVVALISSIKLNAGASAAPPPATAPAPMPGSVLGTWEYVSASTTPMKYNMFTKRMEFDYALASNQFRNVWHYTFEKAGRYTKEIKGLDINRAQDTQYTEKGNYTISGDSIRLEPKECVQGRAPKGQSIGLEKCKVNEPSSFRYLLGPHPTASDRSPGFQVQNQDGTWTSYKPVQ